MAPFEPFTSKVVPLLVDNVDTDQIIPARFLKAVDKTGMGDHLFADWRYHPDGRPKPDFVLNQPGMAGRRLLLVGDNFGAGSSREHAPWALTGFGFRAVLSTSFADIFRNNALKNGLLPIELPAATHARLVALLEADPDAELTIDLAAQTVTLPSLPPDRPGRQGHGEAIRFEVDPFSRQMLLDGTDELGWLLSHADAVAAWERSHPSRIDTTAPAPPA